MSDDSIRRTRTRIRTTLFNSARNTDKFPPVPIRNPSPPPNRPSLPPFRRRSLFNSAFNPLSTSRRPGPIQDNPETPICQMTKSPRIPNSPRAQSQQFKNRYSNLNTSVYNSNQSYASNPSRLSGNSAYSKIFNERYRNANVNDSLYNSKQSYASANSSIFSDNSAYMRGINSNSKCNCSKTKKNPSFSFKRIVIPTLPPSKPLLSPIKPSSFSNMGTLATIEIAINKKYITNILKEPTPEKRKILESLPEESYVVTNITEIPKNDEKTNEISQLNTIPPFLERGNSARFSNFQNKLTIEIPETPDMIISLEKHFTKLFPIENNFINRSVIEYNNTVTLILKSVFDLAISSYQPFFAYLYVERPFNFPLDYVKEDSIKKSIKKFSESDIVDSNDLINKNSFFTNDIYVKFSNESLKDFDNKYLIFGLCTLEYKTQNRNNFTNIYINRNFLTAINSSNEQILRSNLNGQSFTRLFRGGKSNKKPTKKSFSYKNKKYIIYVGPKGGEYIKYLGAYKSIKSLNN